MLSGREDVRYVRHDFHAFAHERIILLFRRLFLIRQLQRNSPLPKRLLDREQSPASNDPMRPV
jgi:hypothetical protein